MGLIRPATFEGFRGKHSGETIWVLGSGASLDHVGRGFFDDKTVVAVNRVGIELGLPRFYATTHYWHDANLIQAARPDVSVVVPEADLGSDTGKADRIPSGEGIFFARTGLQLFGAFDAERDWPAEEDTLVVGPTGLHMAMHFAQYLGAAWIVLAGVDCGLLDGKSNLVGYGAGDSLPVDVWARTLPGVAAQLRARGCGVMSLNPFVNLALEGHRFRGPGVSINEESR